PLLGRGQLPEANQAIGAAEGQHAAVAAASHGKGAKGWPVRLAPLLAGGRVPEKNAAVVTAAVHVLAIRRESSGPERAGLVFHFAGLENAVALPSLAALEGVNIA